MRQVTYIIDDEKGFKKSKGYIELEKTEYFKAIYILKEDSTGICFTLTDFNNNPININSLNGYQSMFTNECFNAFYKKASISKEYEDFIEVKEKDINKTIENDLEDELERGYYE